MFDIQLAAREAAERSAKAQGLPPRVIEGAVLFQVAALLEADTAPVEIIAKAA